MAGVHFNVTGDANGWIAATRQAEAATGKMVGSITEEAKKMDNIFKTLATSATTVFTLQQAGQFAKQVAQVRGEFQQLEVAFETMLQSKEKADALMAQVVDTAAKTPFDLQGVANGAKQLLAYGVASDEVNDTLIRLGDIAAGLSIPLNDLVYLYGTTMTQGRLFTQDLRQFQGRGIPLADELAKQFGVTKDAVGELVTAGKVGFPEVQKAIMSMTNEGGKFNNLMAKQSQTITGQISNLEDAIDQMFNEIGKASEGTISGAISMASSLVENYEKVGKIIGGIVTAYGSYKAALISLNAIKKSSIALEAADAVAKRASARSAKEVTAATVLLTKAQKALSASMLTNPYVLAAAAIAALGVGIYALVNAKTKEERIHDRVNSQLERYNENLEKQKSQLQELFNTINSSDSTEMQRVLAMEKLRELYPTILKDLSDEELLKLSAAEATKKLTEENEKLLMSDLGSQILEASKGYDEAMKKINVYKSAQINADVKSYQKNPGYQQAQKDAEKYRFQLEALIGAYNKLSDTNRKAAFLALPADQKIISLEGNNAQLDIEIAELDKKLKELHDKKNQAASEQPQEFKLGSLSGSLYDGGMTEDEILAEIKAKQAQKALNDKEIAENQAKVDADNKALSEKQKKAAYDRQKAEEKAADDLAKMKRDLNNKVSQADIDSMEDGYAKTLRQLKHNLNAEKEAIEQQKKDLLKRKYNDALQSWLAEDPENRKAYDFKYTATLTDDEQQMFARMGALAQQQFNKGREDADKKWEKEAKFFQRQFEIDAMSAGAEKDEAQRQLDNERELHELEMQREAYIEAAKAAHLLAEQKKAAADPKYLIQAFNYKDANKAFDNIVAGVTNRQQTDKADSDKQDEWEYLKQYGSLQQKKEAITEQYNDRIAKATSEGMKKTLKAEMDATLEALDQTYNRAYQNIFKSPEKMSRATIKASIDLAQSEIKKIQSKGALSEDDLGDIERLQQAIDNLQEYSDSSFWSNFGGGLDGVIAKANQLLSIRKRIKLAQESGDANALKSAKDEQAAAKENLKQNLAGAGVDLFVSGLSSAAGSMREIAELSGDARLKELAETFENISGLVGSVASGAATGGWVGALVGGLTSVFGMLQESLVNSEKELIEARTNAEDFAAALKKVSLEIDNEKFDSIFGTNRVKYINEAIEKYALATEEYEQKLQDSKDWKDAGPDFFGYNKFSQLQGLDSLQGMRIKTYDASGWEEFWGGEDKYTRLIDLAPELWGKDGVFDTEKAKLFLETNTQITENQRKQIQNYIDLADAADEAKKAIDDWLNSFVGETAQSLTDAIFDAIDSGGDAWDSFGEKGNEVIRSLGKEMLKSIIQSDLQSVWSERIKAVAGDPEALAKEYAAMMEWLKTQSESYANIAREWEDTHGTDAYSTRSATEKGIAQASQSSVEELNGRMTAIQSHTFSINQQLASVVNINSQILARVVNIEGNTGRLEGIEDFLRRLGSDMSDIVTRGIKMRG